MKTNCWFVRLLTILISYSLILPYAPLMCAEETAAPPNKNLEMLPSDTVGIMHVNNMPKCISAFKESILFKGARKFVETDAFKKMAANEPDTVVIKDLIFSILDSLPKAFPGELTTAFLTFDKEKDRPDIVILADANEKEFNGLINTLIVPAVDKLKGPALAIEKSDKYSRIGPKDKNEGLYYAIEGGKITMSPYEWISDRPKVTKSLADDVLFRSTMEKLTGTPDALLYVNLRQALKLAGVEEGNRFLSISGFGNIGGIAAATRSVKNGDIGELTLFAPDGLTGVLALLNRQASMPSIEKYIPQDYTFFIRFSVGDFGDFYKETISLLKKRAWRR